MTPNLQDFSPYLFWDTERNALDQERSKVSITERVLSHGMLSDWELLKTLYGKEALHEIVLSLRYLDKYALAFCAAYFNEPVTNFRCYNYAQSNPAHWSY